MAHQYSRVGFDSSVEVNEVNSSLYYDGVVSTLHLHNDLSDYVNVFNFCVQCIPLHIVHGEITFFSKVGQTSESSLAKFCNSFK